MRESWQLRNGIAQKTVTKSCCVLRVCSWTSQGTVGSWTEFRPMCGAGDTHRHTDTQTHKHTDTQTCKVKVWHKVTKSCCVLRVGQLGSYAPLRTVTQRDWSEPVSGLGYMTPSQTALFPNSPFCSSLSIHRHAFKSHLAAWR